MKTITLFLIFLAPLFVFAQIQRGQTVYGEALGDQSGKTVSLCKDGSIMAIGAVNNDENGTNSGHVRVFQNTGGDWTQIGVDIDGEAMGNLFGHGLSLNSDGNIVAIGAPFNSNNGNQSGHVRVYQNSEGNWIQIGDDINGTAAGDHSGYALSLNADGTIVAIGAYANDGNGNDAGQARVLKYDNDIWTPMGAYIYGAAAGDEFGSSISINDDGSIVAVSGPLNDGNGTDSGHVRVYEYDGSTWNQLGADIYGEAAMDRMGYWNGTLDLNASGNIVAIGSHLNDGINGDQSGHVRVYEYDGSTWTQKGQDIDGMAEDDNSGSSVSLSDDGSIVAIGAPRNDGIGIDSGHVRVYEYYGSTWSQIGADIDGEAENDKFGEYLSLTADGVFIAIGAPLNDGPNGNESAIGQVRVFFTGLGINDNSQLDFSVYPSPTSGILNIQSDNPISQIEIYNLLGQLVKSNTNQNSIDISSVDQGIYFIKVMDENGNIGSKKVVKK